MKHKKYLNIFIICSLCSASFLLLPSATAIDINDPSVSPNTFSPDGNGLNDSVTITFDSDFDQTLYLNIFYNATQLIRSDLGLTENPTGTYRATWNGKDDNGSYVTDEGTYTIRATETLGGGGGTIVDTVSVDLTAPSSPSLSIDGGASSTTTRNVNLTISATGATKMKVSNYANYTSATWETYSTSKEWQLLSGDGTKTIYINFRDAAGTNVSTTDTITLDGSISTPSLSINSGSSSTNNLTVSLSITASDATYMKIDNNTYFENMTSWITKARNYTFTLPGGADGTRTVYLRVKDDAGNVKTTSDSINVDSTAPTGLEFSINDDASYTNNQTVSLSISASGGPSTIWLSNNGSVYSSTDYTTSLTWNLSSTDGTKTVYCKVADAAGNNASTSANIILDTVNPSSVSLSSPSAGQTLSSQEPTFSWSNPNQQSQTRQFKIQILQTGTIKQSSTLNASTTSYTADTLAEGSYSWKVIVYDMANNSATSTQRSFTISVDGLAIPSPTYPASNARVNDTTPRLRWSQVSGQGTVYYDYKYGNSSQNLTNTGSTTNLYVDTTTYENGQQIYWAVRSRNTSTQSNYSQIRSCIVDTQAPILHNISIADGDLYVTSRSVTLTLNITGANWVKLSENANFSGASWSSYSTSKSYTLSSSEGIKKIYVIAKDNAVGDQGSTQYANVNHSEINDTIILDISSPSFSNPIPSNGGSTTTTSNLPIQLTYADNGTGISTNKVYINVDGSNVTNSATITTTKVSYTLSTVSTGSHTVNVTVSDNASHIGYYNWSFTVSTSTDDEDDAGGGGGLLPPADAAPVISDISFSPTTVTSSDMITITATVTDDNGLESVDVYFDDGTLDSKTMTAEDNSSIYTATIGPFSGGKNIIFYINAVDNAPQTSTSTNHSFNIQDNEQPTITIISPEDNAIITDTTPIISAIYTDNGGIDSENIILKIDGKDVTEKTSITNSKIKYTPTTALSYSTHTVTLKVSDNSNNTAQLSWSFTIQAETQKINKTIAKIEQGETQKINLQSYDTAIEYISITAAETMENISLSLTTTLEQPSTVNKPDETVYLYLLINAGAIEKMISEAVISFKIEQSWFSNSEISKDSVTLMHHRNGTWQKLSTTKTDEDDSHVYFEAVTPGFSTFAITGKISAETPITLPWIYIIVGIAAIIAVAAIVFIIWRKQVY